MKIEDIKTQVELDGFVQVAIDEAKVGLIAKNAELLGKMKVLESKIPDNLQDLVDAAKKLKELESKSLEDQGNFKLLYEQAKDQHKIELGTMQISLDAEKLINHGLMVKDGLSVELSKHNVNPVLLDPAISLLSTQVSVIEIDGNRTAQVGEKDLTSYVADWAKTDVGKNFILATENKGGDAQGNKDVQKGMDDTEKWFVPKTANLTEQAKVFKVDPVLYNTLKEKHRVIFGADGAIQTS